MCGIVGVIDFAGTPVPRELIERMCEAVRHRGPDARGILCLPESPNRSPNGASLALGHQRLSIIDVQGGRQPIANEDGTVWAVLNGEIYNFQAIRAQLEARGHRFTTKSDTEVIVHLYEDHGEDFVRQLDGMFALALWDNRQQRLILARDRFGKKPLLYAQVRSRVVFGSEFRALLQETSIPRTLDLEALEYYLAYMSIPAPYTIYQAIRKLPPAHLMVVDRHGMRLQSYWNLSFAPKLAITEPEAAERLRELLTQAVRKRLISEVPLGAFLSGGVDSSVVVALMARESVRPVKTFSIGFDEKRYDELPEARRIASAFGCDHHEFVVRPNALDVLPTLIEHFGEPFADSSAIPTYYLSRLTREHVTVALTGDGGDEAFAGYHRHVANRFAEFWQRAPISLRRAVQHGAHMRNGAAAPHRSWRTNIARLLAGVNLSRAARYRQWVGVLGQEWRQRLGTWPAPWTSSDPLVERLFQASATLDAVDAALAVDTAFYLPTDLLVKMDIATMANSLEARSPFLDYHLMEFVARLPSHMKLRGMTSKYLLKRAMGAFVPSYNLSRPKRGFAIPIDQWFRGDLREFLFDHLSTSHLARSGLFAQAAMLELLSEHVSGRANYGHQLWTLLVLELWYRQAGVTEFSVS